MPKKTNIFAEPVEETVAEPSEVVVTPIIEVPNTKRARVKGTWLMHWGATSFNFEDGKSYQLPNDLYAYLRNNGNIYDTL